MQTGRIVQLSQNQGGVPKLPVTEAWAAPLGLSGDAVRHPEIHGGPDKALLLVSAEDLATLAAAGFAVYPGALGENLTITGLDFRALRIGQRFRAGAAVIQLTKVRRPCSQLDVYNSPGLAIEAHIYDERVRAGDPTSPRWAMSGFYARVVLPGLIRTGDAVALLDASA